MVGEKKRNYMAFDWYNALETKDSGTAKYHARRKVMEKTLSFWRKLRGDGMVW
jgi:hypothetical protein